MALDKKDIPINFGKGLDTKSDKFQVAPGNFLELNNAVFNKAGLLQKRNGFDLLSTLPSASVASPAAPGMSTAPDAAYVATFNGGLEVVANQRLYSLSSATNKWANKGFMQPASLQTMPIIRSANNQSYADSAMASNGLICTAYTDNPQTGVTYKYTVVDNETGQVIVAPTTITAASGTTNASPRVFVLGNYFVIIFGTSSNHIQYIAISTSDPTQVVSATDITSSYVSSSTINYDGIVVNDRLVIAFNSTSGGQSVKVTYLTPSLGAPVTAVVFAGAIATMFALAADVTTPQSPKIYVSYYDLASTTAKILCVDQNLNTILAPTTILTSGTLRNLALTARDGYAFFFYEVANAYSYDAAIPSNLINKRVISQAGVVGSATTIIRSVGLASKAMIYNFRSYFLATYQSTPQPSYFLVDESGNIISKLAYGNGRGYLTAGLPALNLCDSTELCVAYLIKDLISSTNKGTDLAAGTPTAAVYSELGVKLAKFNLDPSTITSVEIGGTLNFSGGIVWSFDGSSVTEQGFNLYPDSIEVTTATTGGNLADDTYYYQVCYEWSDNNGNIYRSAPSLPVSIVTSGGGASTNTIQVPNLRLTYKSQVKIVVYRWSISQPVYYSITSPASAPTLSSTTSDSTTITDTLADASIIGNPILYTTGGVLENIGAPATNLLTLFDNRMWAIDAEDTNLAWYSKEVISNVPVEMSDLLTMYVAPTTGAQGSTGPNTSFAPMDDKNIFFKENAIYYTNGAGPDNLGFNNQYSKPTFISSVVGCTNQNSIVFIPNGLMFQSNKGIWLLGRDLSTRYIGAPVEDYTTGATVLSAVSVPGTNQVRFTMDSGVTLMYDYYYDQWGTFSGIPAISSVVYEDLHTYINQYGQVLQESPGSYLDNTNPVLLSFKTPWMSFAGVQGFERFYQLLFLGEFFTPFKLNVQFCYDLNVNPQYNVIVTPDNYSVPYGDSPIYGSGSPYGGPSSTFKARVFPNKQKVESFQFIVNEMFDPSFGTQAGAGLTLSGFNMTVGLKKGRRNQSAAKSFG